VFDVSRVHHPAAAALNREHRGNFPHPKPRLRVVDATIARKLPVPRRKSLPFGVARLGGAEDLAACQRAIDLVNRQPDLWPDLFRMTGDDGRTDWQLVERRLIALLERPPAPARTPHRAARTDPLR
jgi:hypothetical protein